MEPVEGARTFQTSGDAYDAFMGRYSNALAPIFAAHLGARAGQQALDVGCGPGALTHTLASLIGPLGVTACDPSPTFVDECTRRNPGVEVHAGRAEALPFPDASFDLVAAQLVFHFVSDPTTAANEFRRVARPGGTIGACVWDFENEMEMLRAFWDAALELDPAAPDEARNLRFGRSGEIAQLFADAELVDINETSLEVQSTYNDFDELWNGFMAGIGPAGAYCTGLPEDHRAELRNRLHIQLGRPSDMFTLSALARATTATRPLPS